jgi:YfiH family protein
MIFSQKNSHSNMLATHLCHRRIPIFASQSGLVAAESTRHGGVSLPPFESLNLGLSTTDEPQRIEKNRQIFFQSLGLAVEQSASAHQVHGDDVLLVEKPGRYDGFDALITAQSGIFLAVTVADCTPILVADPINRVVAGIHAGWKGTIAGLVRKTVLMMQSQYGSNPENCLAYVGTCIDECSFEVDADVADHFSTPYKRWDADRQKFFIDLKAANRDYLLETGIPSTQIEVSPFSTVLHNEVYFSYRKEKGLTGRMINVIGYQDTIASS